MLGLYTWEIITQLPFDWSAISRKVGIGYFSVSSINLMVPHTHSPNVLLVLGFAIDMRSVKCTGPHSSTFTANTRSG